MRPTLQFQTLRSSCMRSRSLWSKNYSNSKFLLPLLWTRRVMPPPWQVQQLLTMLMESRQAWIICRRIWAKICKVCLDCSILNLVQLWHKIRQVRRQIKPQQAPLTFSLIVDTRKVYISKIHQTMNHPMLKKIQTEIIDRHTNSNLRLILVEKVIKLKIICKRLSKGRW